MLLLLGIFKDGQHGHPLSVGHLPPWVAILSPADQRQIISAQNPLHETVSSAGPFDLEGMFEGGNPMIEDMASAADSLSRAAPTPVRALEATANGLKLIRHLAASRRTKRNAAAALAL